jgi:hypothetical protein
MRRGASNAKRAKRAKSAKSAAGTRSFDDPKVKDSPPNRELPSTWCSVSHLISGPLEKQPEDSELSFLVNSLLVAAMMSKPGPPTMPRQLDLQHSERHPLKLKFGNDEVLFLLQKNDYLRTFLDGLKKCPLNTPLCVEVRPSPLGGLGLFTTKDCSPGDLLLSERPMVSTISSCITDPRTNIRNSRL